MEEQKHLSEQQISQVLSFIRPNPMIPVEISTEISRRHYENFARQLRSVKIYHSLIPRLKEKLSNQYYRAQIEPGKMVGALAASSIGEKQAQQSLSSFHTAGQSKVELVTGVPRMEEILNVTRDIRAPSMDVYLDLPEEQLKDLSVVRRIAQDVFEYRELTDLLEDYEIAKDRVISGEEAEWYLFHSAFYDKEYEECQWSVRLKFDPVALHASRKTLSFIAGVIHDAYGDAYCVCSPDSSGVIDVYVRTEDLGSVEEIIELVESTRRKSKKDRKGAEDGGEDGKNEAGDTGLSLVVNDDNKEYYFLRDLVVPSLLFLQVGGLERIQKCYLEETKDGKWFIKTKGSNLRAVINHPLVVSRQGTTQWGNLCTTSNHLWEVYDVFGIEATKNYLRVELSKLMTVSSRHLELLIDSMTYSGRPMAANRYGIDLRQVGVMAKVGFEQPFDNFFHAVQVSERDDMRGVSSAITMGKPPIAGSVMQMLDMSKAPIRVEQMVYDFEKKVVSENPPRARQDNKSSAQARRTTPWSSPAQEKKEPAQEVKFAPKKTSLNTQRNRGSFDPGASASPAKMTVTRIVMREPEMQQLKNPPQTVFKTKKGAVTERKTPIAEQEMEEMY